MLLLCIVFLAQRNIYAQHKERNSKCIDAVISIIKSSPSYKAATNGLQKRVIKNGGTGFSFFVDSSPNQERDMANAPSENYALSIHENYLDRSPTVLQFIFKPASKKLYELDVVSGEEKEIPYKKTTLTIFKKVCE